MKVTEVVVLKLRLKAAGYAVKRLSDRQWKGYHVPANSYVGISWTTEETALKKTAKIAGISITR